MRRPLIQPIYIRARTTCMFRIQAVMEGSDWIKFVKTLIISFFKIIINYTFLLKKKKLSCLLSSNIFEEHLEVLTETLWSEKINFKNCVERVFATFTFVFGNNFF